MSIIDGNLHLLWLKGISHSLYTVLYVLGFLVIRVKSGHWKTHVEITAKHKELKCYTNSSAAAAAAKFLQWCPTLCDPISGSPPGSPIPGILQARILEWVAISFSNAWKWKVKVKSLSHVRLLATPWTAAHQAPLSMGVEGTWKNIVLKRCVKESKIN